YYDIAYKIYEFNNYVSDYEFEYEFNLRYKDLENEYHPIEMINKGIELVEYIVNYYLDIILKIMDEEAENARNRIYEKDLEDFEEMVVFYRESITYFFNSPYIAPYDISFYENQLDNFKNYIYSMDFDP